VLVSHCYGRTVSRSGICYFRCWRRERRTGDGRAVLGRWKFDRIKLDVYLCCWHRRSCATWGQCVAFFTVSITVSNEPSLSLAIPLWIDTPSTWVSRGASQHAVADRMHVTCSCLSDGFINGFQRRLTTARKRLKLLSGGSRIFFRVGWLWEPEGVWAYGKILCICKLHQRGLGQSPSRNRIWCIFALKCDIWCQ